MYRSLYDDQVPLLRYLASVNVPLPSALRTTAELVLAADLRRSLEGDDLDVDAIGRLLVEANDLGLVLPVESLAFTASTTLTRLARRLEADPHAGAAHAELSRAVAAIARLPFPVERWAAQNVVYRWLHDTTAPEPDLAALGEMLGLATI